jgi:hypothetical protein
MVHRIYQSNSDLAKINLRLSPIDGKSSRYNYRFYGGTKSCIAKKITYNDVDEIPAQISRGNPVFCIFNYYQKTEKEMITCPSLLACSFKFKLIGKKF